MLAAIWSDLDNLLSAKTKITKEEKPVCTNICIECSGIKVLTREGFPTCSDCGLVDSIYIDQKAEWTNGVGEDGKVDDKSRCGNPNSNPELFSQNWGKGSIISTNHFSKYETKRMAKINFHMSMNHRDRSLYHAYQEMDELCGTLPDVILKEAKMLYKKFNEEKLTRGAIRLGVKANCILYACRIAKHPRTTKEISDMFNIQPKDISRTSEMFKGVINGLTEKNYTTQSFDVIQRVLNSFDISKDERLKCYKYCKLVQDCVELMSKTPKSVAAAVVWCVIGHRITKNELCENCSVSIPTLNKIGNIIKKYLEEKGEL